MTMDNCMDSRENGNERVNRKVRAGLYAIDLCKSEMWQKNKRPHLRKSFEPRRKFVSQ